MKALVPHRFIQMIKKYTLNSMIEAIVFWSFDMYNSGKGSASSFADYRICSGFKKVLLFQTALLDLLYFIIKYNNYGKERISPNDSLELINAFYDYMNKTTANHRDPIVSLYGMMGEQARFQMNDFTEEFAREKYILEEVSKKWGSSDDHIDYNNEFFEETGMTTDQYSTIIICITCFYSSMFNLGYKIGSLKGFASELGIPFENFRKMIDKYSITLDGIRKSKLKRQVFYVKPIIKMTDTIICITNPYLMLCLFANSNYWVLRDKYCRLNSTSFTNAFGHYFEIYVEEILERCLDNSSFIRIPEADHQKRADWRLQLNEFDIIIEQKSTLPLLSVRQTDVDTCALKDYVVECWGEAYDQLISTEQSLCLNNPIKIILLYDTHFITDALDMLFELKSEIPNDGRLWLLTIREFEMLLLLYKLKPDSFRDVMLKKITLEKNKAIERRDFLSLFYEANVYDLSYVKHFGIYQNYRNIMERFTDTNSTKEELFV